ncbi:hypothetical protein TTHERM_00147580 (macronuclear) [Tetrahymena thermophila SB210]|uniref:Uncharacterized protein n=1 Tax=Tetrahymena thermophila (strain SB210) TaxID=312017 RepID=I7MG91_TETTS|nr:hypothetical protein TTHERM_00147580 [Tetrahymena thermophila SB210]EAS01247.1 hypothetical protein TTHERM_00147580 [Tetrahymena thermophila SB210]|eukprot:XP_001021492.1 hypothetical protein TTHERM_00147580 [Tetrahymena thermophila SB210]
MNSQSSISLSQSSINIQQSSLTSSLYIPLKQDSYSAKNKKQSKQKLFCNATPYSCISQELSDHISSISNGEMQARDSGFSTAVNSLMHSQNEQATPCFNENSSNHQYAKSYAPSPVLHFKSNERDNSSESGSSQNSQYQFGQKSQTEKNLQTFHQEAFKFLLTLNSNLQKFKDAENRRKLQKELNLDKQQLTMSQFNNSDVVSTNTLYSSQSAAPSVVLRKSKVVDEKKNTVQSIIASTFCKSQMFNKKKSIKLNRQSNFAQQN